MDVWHGILIGIVGIFAGILGTLGVQWIAARLYVGPPPPLTSRTTPPTATSPEQLLAETIRDADRAAQLLIAAGYPRGRIPAFKDPQTYWACVLDEARAGVLPGGARPILEAAAAMYPHHPALVGYRGGGASP